MTTFVDAASQAAAQLDQQYRDEDVFEGGFWFGGNALHAYLRALLATGKGDDTRLLVYAYEAVYAPAVKNPGARWWHDDYGWWGCAFCTAVVNRAALGYGDASFDPLFQQLLEAATSCWGLLDENWRDVPYTAHSDNAANDSGITGGTFNTAPVPEDPDVPMSGRNTVTNAGFWLLSHELASIDHHAGGGNPAFGLRAGDLARWFGEWISESQAGRPGVLTPDGLVLERPTGNATYPGWYWSGDQGVVLIDLLNQAAQEWPPPYADSLGAKIAIATMEKMSVDGILQENLGFRAYGTEPRNLRKFSVDYATGKGIFLRHLGDACELLGADWTNRSCGEFIHDNASAVWQGRNAMNHQIRFNWDPSGDEVEMYDYYTPELRGIVFEASGLDALTAAARFWPTEEID